MAYAYVVKGKSTTLSSSVAGGAAEGFTFEWTKDGASIGGTGKIKTLSNFSEADVGTYTVTAKKDAEDDVVDTFERGIVLLEVTKPTVRTISKVEGDTETLTVTGGKAKFVPTTTDIPTLNKYKTETTWTKNGTAISNSVGESYTTPVLAVSDNGVKYGVSQTLKEDNTVVITEKFEVAIIEVTEKPVIVDPENNWYIVPLPHLKSSFTWIGYWVIDEIMKNPDWFDNHADLKYAQQIQVIVKAFGENSDVMLMESRNGRILKVSDLK